MFIFFLLCSVLGCLLSFISRARFLTALRWFFCLFVFTEGDFVVQPKTIHLLVNLKADFYWSLQSGKVSLNRFVGFTYKLYKHGAIWGELSPIFNFCGKHFWPVGKLTWLNKNIFHSIVETGLKNDFIMYYFQCGPWIVKTVSCFCPLVLPTCHNGELPIVRPHRPLCYAPLSSSSV